MPGTIPMKPLSL